MYVNGKNLLLFKGKMQSNPLRIAIFGISKLSMIGLVSQQGVVQNRVYPINRDLFNPTADFLMLDGYIW